MSYTQYGLWCQEWNVASLLVGLNVDCVRLIFVLFTVRYGTSLTDVVDLFFSSENAKYCNASLLVGIYYGPNVFLLFRSVMWPLN